MNVEKSAELLWGLRVGYTDIHISDVESIRQSLCPMPNARWQSLMMNQLAPPAQHGTVLHLVRVVAEVRAQVAGGQVKVPIPFEVEKFYSERLI